MILKTITFSNSSIPLKASCTLETARRMPGLRQVEQELGVGCYRRRPAPTDGHRTPSLHVPSGKGPQRDDAGERAGSGGRRLETLGRVPPEHRLPLRTPRSPPPDSPPQPSLSCQTAQRGPLAWLLTVGESLEEEPQRDERAANTPRRAGESRRPGAGPHEGARLAPARPLCWRAGCAAGRASGRARRGPASPRADATGPRTVPGAGGGAVPAVTAAGPHASVDGL